MVCTHCSPRTDFLILVEFYRADSHSLSLLGC